MSEQVNKEQTKDAKQEKITELSDEQLAEAKGGSAPGRLPADEVLGVEDPKEGLGVEPFLWISRNI